MLPERKDLVKAVSFKTSRSGGKGGQHVNKVSSKVELIFFIDGAAFFSPEQKQLLKERLAGKLDQEGNLHVIAQEDRSQLVNKQTAVDKLMVVLCNALHVDKLRRPTRTQRSVILKRRSDKRTISLKKESRRKPGLDF